LEFFESSDPNANHRRKGHSVGHVIDLDQRRMQRARWTVPGGRRPRVGCIFEVGSPWTYLSAERIDRQFAGVRWQPALPAAMPGGARQDDVARIAAERRARELRLPLVWPDRLPAGSREAARVAALAAEFGRAATFVLAAGRLAFCGGFDLDDTDVLIEAAAAAELDRDAALAAAADASRDAGLEAAGRWVASRGGTELPALVVNGMLFCGEHRLAEAAAAGLGVRARA
jgi:2-hydroxychromene-2-carboxylate isomerase